MDEVDDIVLRALRDLDCELEDVKTIEDMSAPMFTHCVVVCLRRINGTEDYPSDQLPHAMTARYSFCTRLSDSIKNLGYMSTLGYQALLYANAKTMRDVLIFLVEKLPKDADRTAIETKTPLDLLRSLTAASVSKSLDSDWVPVEIMRMVDICHNQAPIYKQEFRTQFPEATKRNSDFNHNLEPRLCLIASLIEHLDLMKSSEKSPVQSKKQTEELKSKPAKPPKPSIMNKPLVKPKIQPKPVHHRHGAESEAAETAEGREEKEKVEAEQRILQELKSIEESVKSMKREILEMRQGRTQLESQIEAKRSELQRREKLASILPNAAEAIPRLKEFIADADTRMNKLKEKWEETSAPLQMEIFNASHAITVPQTDAEKLRLEYSHMKQELQDIMEEDTGRDEWIAALKREVDRQEPDRGRSSYTRRILEIVASIQKQNDEIDKILCDTRSVQHDIQMLTGKLDRTFTATDDLVFRSMSTDQAANRVYKLIMALHENCVEIRTIVESAGELRREIRDLEDEIGIEKQKDVVSSLNKIMADYKAVKDENDLLKNNLAQ